MAEGSERPEDLSRTLLGGSEFNFDFYCYPCHEDGRHFEAVGYCKDCRDYLCDECYRSHCRPKQLRHHVVLDSTHMPKDVTYSRKVVHTDSCTDPCNIHPDKVNEYYCHTHDVLACSACAFSDHRKCDKVDLIADVADRTGNNKELSDTQAQLQDLAQQAHQNIQTTQANISLSNKCKTIATKSLKEYIHETISSLKKLEKELESEANEVDSTNEKKLKAASSRSDSVLVEIKGTLQSLSILENNKQYCNLYVAVKKAQKTLPTLTRELARTRQNSIVDEFKFEPNLQLQSMLHDKGGIGDIIAAKAHSEERVNTLDTPIGVSGPDSKQTTTSTSVISSKENTSVEQTLSESSDPDHGQVKNRKQSGANSSSETGGSMAESANRTPTHRSADNVQHKDINARFITNIKVKSKSDSKQCYISGVAELSGGKLLAVDNNNSKVKVIDLNKQTMINELTLESRPWDVTSIDKNELAVTLPNVRKIQYVKVSVDGTVSTSRTVNVNGACHGIAFARDKLWVSFTSPGKLEALTLDGELLLRISYDASGQELFTKPHYIALSPDMETIYVSDFNTKTVFRLSSTGTLLSDCKLQYGPYSVSVAADGTVFACNSGGEVYMLTAECKNIMMLLDAYKADAARSLAYDVDTRRLFVGTVISEIIQIFQITGF